MKTLSTISVLLFLPIFLFSQDFYFNISGRSGYTLPSNSSYTQEYKDATIRTYLNDSMAIEQLVDNKYEITTNYKSKIAYELEANINFPIFKRACIQTGIGLNWISFNRTTDFTNYEMTLKETIDTIAYEWNNNVYEPLCDRYLNEEVFDEREDGERYQVLNLTIPISFKCPIGNSKFALKGGVYLQTPIYSQVSREYITLETEETPTEVVCTYVLQKNEDNTGQRIKDLQLGCHAELEYALQEKLRLSLNITQNLSSLTNNYSSFTETATDKFLPMRISGGLNLYLGKESR